MFVFSSRAFAFAAAAALLTACSGAQSAIPSNVPAQSLLRAAASTIAASPAKLNFTTTPALKLTVSEKNYKGAFKFAVSPSGLVKLKPVKGKGPSTTVTVTALNAGKGTFTISDAKGKSVGVPVTVTKGVIIIQ